MDMMNVETFYQELLDLIESSMSSINHNLVDIRKEMKELAIQQTGHGHDIINLKSNHATITSIIIRTWLALIGAVTSVVIAIIGYSKK